MIKAIVRSNDNRTRTPAEVKRLLHDLAFVLQASRLIKLQIVSAKEQKTVRPVAATPSSTLIRACAL
jgi:hypothetical protein